MREREYKNPGINYTSWRLCDVIKTKFFQVVSEMTKCAKNQNLEESCTLTGGKKSDWVSRSQKRIKIHQTCSIKKWY